MPQDNDRRPPEPRPIQTDEMPPETWGGEGGAGDYAGGPVTSSGRRRRKGPPGSGS